MKFNFFPTPEIIFGNGTLPLLPELIKRYGSHALLITGGSSFRSTASYAKMENSLSKAGIKLSVESLAGEPSVDFVDLVTHKYKGVAPHCVVSIGGGSAIDAGKAVSAMLRVEGSVKDYLEGVGHRAHPGDKVPFIAVSTSSGTGSEATYNAVISQVGPDGYKKSLRHTNLMPNIALVDPTLTLTCPPSITASSGMDALTQLIEAYVSTEASPFTDALTHEALRLIPSSLEAAYSNGQDFAARESMAYASLVSGIALANAGLGVVHGFASPIGGYFNIPHGVVCGTLLPPATRITIEKLIETGENPNALKKYAEVGKIFSSIEGKKNEYYCRFLIDKLYELADRMTLPKLSAYGISSKDLPMIIKGSGSKNNPIKLSEEEMMRVLSERI